MAKDCDFPGFSVPECPSKCGHSLRESLLCFRSALRHHTHRPSPLFNSLEDELRGQCTWNQGEPKNRILCDGDILPTPGGALCLSTGVESLCRVQKGVLVFQLYEEALGDVSHGALVLWPRLD